MDKSFLQFYEDELAHLRTLSYEFAQKNPNVARYLLLEEFDCKDPYVERLLEGFAFLAARVQYKIKHQFVDFTNHLLNIIYPNFIAPVPAMTIVCFQPKLKDLPPPKGVPVPKGTRIKSSVKANRSVCEFVTGHDFDMYPIEVAKIDYLASKALISEKFDLFEKQNFTRFAESEVDLLKINSALTIKLKCLTGVTFDKLQIDKLVFYLDGGSDRPYRLYELLIAHAKFIFISSANEEKKPLRWLSQDFIRPIGFSPAESLLPESSQRFDCYRVLQEYFTYPQRFLFVEFNHLAELLKGIQSDEINLTIGFNETDFRLADVMDSSSMLLNAVPVINLFARETDSTHINSGKTEYRLVVENTSPNDYEIFRVNKVFGYISGSKAEYEFASFYRLTEQSNESNRYFSVKRKERILNKPEVKKHLDDKKFDYKGSEIFVTLVDRYQAPIPLEINRINADVLCTNRDLPKYIIQEESFTPFIGLPVEAIKCISNPSSPRNGFLQSSKDWRLINQLSFNYLSLVNQDKDFLKGATALREFLKVYIHTEDMNSKGDLINGIVSVETEEIVRRIVKNDDVDDELAKKTNVFFVRGLKITVKLDESAYSGHGYFLMAMVLEYLFSQSVALNSYVETVLKTVQKADIEVAKWKAKPGKRKII